MATFIEAGFLGYFNSLFIFLFVFVAVYAVLTTSKWLGENNAIKAFMSIVLAVLFASSSRASKIFEYATPWIMFLFLLVLFFELFTKFMGSENAFSITNTPVMMTIVLLLIVVIFMISAGQVSKEERQKAIDSGEIKEGDNTALTFPAKVGETLRHPAVLGLITIFLIATFAIMMLAKAS